MPLLRLDAVRPALVSRKHAAMEPGAAVLMPIRAAAQQLAEAVPIAIAALVQLARPVHIVLMV